MTDLNRGVAVPAIAIILSDSKEYKVEVLIGFIGIGLLILFFI